jgi:hypothetical protein
MRWKVVLGVIGALSWSGAGLRAETAFTVDVDVACDDTATRTLARGLFSRELRELGDVNVISTDVPDYKIRAIAIKEKRGWVLSVVIGARLDGDSIAAMDSQVAAALADYARTVHHSLTRGDSSEDLDREISLIVQSLDNDVLEPLRE